MVAILCVLLSVVVRNAHKDFYEFGLQERHLIVLKAQPRSNHKVAAQPSILFHSFKSPLMRDK